MKKQHNIANLLSKLGLNVKEVNVYMSLLKLGGATVSQIANDSGIVRTYVYDIAEDLKKKGLAGMIERRGIRTYKGLNHAELVAFVKRKSEEWETLGKEISEAVSDFDSAREHARQSTTVEFFSGAEGVLNIYDRIKSDLKKLQKPFEIITIFSPEKLEAVFPGWFEQKKYIDTSPLMTKRDIVHESEVFQKHLKQREQGLGKYFYKIWPKEKGEFPIDTLCWENKTAFIELTSYPTGTIIENEALAKTFRMWFENIWENL